MAAGYFPHPLPDSVIVCHAKNMRPRAEKTRIAGVRTHEALSANLFSINKSIVIPNITAASVNTCIGLYIR